MNVVYYIDNPDPIYRELLEISLRSLHKTNQGAYAALICTEEIRNKISGNMAGLAEIHTIGVDRKKYYTYNKHMGYYDINLNEALYIDTDTIFQGDVSIVFDDLSWENAIAARSHPIGKKYPYNSGVHFCRNREFFKELANTPCHTTAMRVEEAFCRLIDSDKYRRFVLHPKYNYSPNRKGEAGIDSAKIVHYKGDRKKWMLERGRLL